MDWSSLFLILLLIACPLHCIFMLVRGCHCGCGSQTKSTREPNDKRSSPFPPKTARVR